jgi:hypothetical protein
MKNLEEKKLLVKMARMLGEEVDPALLESIEREEKLASVFFGAPAPEPKAPPIPILKEDLPQPEVKPPEEPIVEAPADIVPEKEQLVQQIANTLTVPSSKTSPYRDKEIEGIRKQIAEMMQKISTMSWGGGGTGIVRIGDADDFDRATYGENRYLTWSDGWFRLIDGPSGGNSGNTTYISTPTYTVTDNDYYLGVDYPGTVNITIPSSTTTGRMIVVKDESGNCSNNPIIVAGTIDNDAGGFNLQIDNGAIQMLYRSGWRII